MPAINWKTLMDTTEKEAKEFEILGEGMYAFFIKDAAKVGETSKGNPKFTINPTVESGPRANARVFHDFIVSDSAYAMKNFFFGDLAILGLNATFFETNPDENQIAQALQGRRFTAEVYHEEGNNGKTYARLRNFGGATSAPPAAGVPGGLPAASAPIASAPAAPVAQVAAAPAVDPSSPWATTAAPAAQFNKVAMPPAFG